jgi:hypothetical protein
MHALLAGVLVVGLSLSAVASEPQWTKKELDAVAGQLDDEIDAARLAPRIAISSHLSKINPLFRQLKDGKPVAECLDTYVLYTVAYFGKIRDLESFAGGGRGLPNDPEITRVFDLADKVRREKGACRSLKEEMKVP